MKVMESIESVKRMVKSHNERVESNKELIDTVYQSVKKYITANTSKKDPLVWKYLDQLKEMPSVWLQTEQQLKRTAFIVRGLVCRTISNQGNKYEHLKMLDKVKFYFR